MLVDHICYTVLKNKFHITLNKFRKCNVLDLKIKETITSEMPADLGMFFNSLIFEFLKGVNLSCRMEDKNLLHN